MTREVVLTCPPPQILSQTVVTAGFQSQHSGSRGTRNKEKKGPPAQQVQALAAKSECLSLSLGTHIVEGEKFKV